jgi:RHS repeat-associated protein
MKTVLIALLLLALPTIGWSQTAPQAGTPNFSSIEAGSVDSVNRQNLNTEMQFPIVAGRGRGLGFNFALTYNSLLWEKNGVNWSFSPMTDYDNSPGWNLNEPVGFLTLQDTVTICHPSGASTHFYGYIYVEANGTQHSIPGINYTVTCADTVTGTTSGFASDSSGFFVNAISTNKVFGPDGTQYLNNLKDTNGNFVTLGPTVTDSAGHAILITTQTSSHITYQYLGPTGAYQTITLALASYSVKTNFGCTGIGEFTGTATLPSSLTYPNGWVYSFTYEPTPGNTGFVTGRLSKITLPNGGYVQYAFGGSNDGINCLNGNVSNLTRTINDGTNSWVWQFVNSEGQTTVTAPLMPYDTTTNQTVFTFNSSNQETSEQIYQGGASGGTLLRTINTTWSGNTPATKTTILEDNSTQSEIETSYDTYSNLLSLKEHDYGSGAPGPILRTTTTTYNTTSPFTNLNILNRETESTVADSTGTIQYRKDTAYGGTTISPCPTGVAQHDDTNYPCSFTTRGNPTSVTTYTNAGAPSGGVTKNSYYDIFGNLVQQDADCCQSIQWTYSSTTLYAYPDSFTKGITGGTQLTSNLTYNAYTGQVASMTDPNNLTTSFAYDLLRRLTTTTRPDNAQIVRSYNDTLHTETVTSPIQGSNVRKDTSYLDGLGQTIQATAFDGSGTSYASTQTQYDGVGRGYNVSNPYTTTPQYWTGSTFDALGRQLKTVLPDSNQVTYSYSGPSVTKTDPAGHQKKQQQDGLGRLATVYDPDPSNGNSLTLQTNYSYTVLDQKATVTQGVQTRTFAYDGMGRMTSQNLPESGTTAFQYNSFNQLNQRTDARGVITTYTYDSLNRPYQISYNVGSTGVPATPTVTYSYGTNITQLNNGNMLTLTDGLGTTTYSYDNLIRPIRAQHVINGNTYTVGYQYNLAGSVASVTYPSGRVVQTAYDSIGRISTLSSGTTTYASNFAYNPSFFATSYLYGNGVTTTIGYSPDRLQLTSLSYVGGTTVFSTTYSHTQNSGNNGQITGITDAYDAGRSSSYTYDALGRLVTAGTSGSTKYPKWGLSFSYDPYGNRTNQTVTAGMAPSNSVVVNPATNRITTSGYGYDANGNMTNDGMNSMVYDAENRVVSITGVSGTATYSYRASGFRAVKVFGGTTTTYMFDDNNDVAEYSNGTLANEYVYLGARPIATHVSGTLYYDVADHLSIREFLDTSGNIVANTQRGQYPFGEDWYVGTMGDRHFTTFERDSESGNDYAIHRFHVNRLGRFSAGDLISGNAGAPQSLNRFSYVRNDPVNRRDPRGMTTIWCFWFAIFCPGDGSIDDGEGGGGGAGNGGTGGDCLPGSENCGSPTNPVPPPTPVLPSCYADLRYRPVKYTGGIANHAFWITRDVNQVVETSEGGPNKGPLFAILGLTTVTHWVSDPKDPHFAADTSAATLYRSFANNDIEEDQNVCAAVLVMTTFAKAFPDGTIRYNPFKGPNSNSFARALLEYGGFPLAMPPPRTTGWKAPLYW